MKFLPPLLLALLAALPCRADVIETDILVFGGNAAGVAAACTAAQLGKRTLVTEYGRHLGGLTSGGLGWTDIGNKAAIGGFGHDFYRRLGIFYGKEEAWTFEPHVAEAELRAQMLKANVKAYFNQRLASVKKEGLRIVEITMEDGSVYRAKIFLDCSYEGDLMAKAGVKYMIGREANAQFGEEINGIRGETPAHQFKVNVDPFVKPGEPASGLLPLVQPALLGTPGAADASVQAYNFRLCFTQKAENKRPIEPPPDYDAARFELFGRYFQALAAAGQKPTLKTFFKIDMVTPDKTDINNNGAFSTDYIGYNHGYPEAGYAERDKMWKEHENYIRGLITFIVTDARVPENVRTEMKSWGLCKDEFQDTGGWPHQLYVREARRMIGEYIMSEKNCRWVEKVEDSVGLGAYGMDSHNCRRIVRDGFVRNEGDVQVGVKGPYPVSYHSLVPKASECENLLVPVCLSATHIAYGSIRMEPVFMIMGQSAATAASIAIDDVVPVQKVNYARLRERLLEDKQVLEWTGAARAEARLSVPPKLDGIVLDDSDAKKTGDWESGGIVQDRQVGAGYIHDGNARKGELALRWTPEIPEAGSYEIIFRFPPNGNRATNVPLIVEIDGKQTAVRVDQRNPGSKGAVSLGTYDLPKGLKTSITLSTEGTNGFVVADGLQVLKK